MYHQSSPHFKTVRLTRVWRSAHLFTLLFTVLTLLAFINIPSRIFLEFFWLLVFTRGDFAISARMTTPHLYGKMWHALDLWPFLSHLWQRIELLWKQFFIVWPVSPQRKHLGWRVLSLFLSDELTRCPWRCVDELPGSRRSLSYRDDFLLLPLSPCTVVHPSVGFLCDVLECLLFCDHAEHLFLWFWQCRFYLSPDSVVVFLCQMGLAECHLCEAGSHSWNYQRHENYHNL